MNAQLVERPASAATTRTAACNLAALRLHDLPLIQRAARLRRASRAASLGAMRSEALAERDAEREMRELAARLAARAQAAKDLAGA
jgi:hypothetical protein